MKKQILKAFTLLMLAGGISGCGEGFLETDYYKGVDSTTGLGTVNNIGTALNGTYYNLFYYYFAGNYAITIGDIPTDISYWNTLTGHWDNIYKFTFTDTENYLRYIWEYGYRVADNAARVIQAADNLYGESNDAEKASLDLYMAEAYALRGYSQLLLANIYGHQIKVNGTDFSSELGIVVIDEPKPALVQVARSTVGESYAAIVSDLKNALIHFTAAGKDRGDLNYLGIAAVNGLLARTYLYMEDWANAKQYAEAALNAEGITTLTYGNDAYKALYNSGTSNSESMFALSITASQNWSANSCGSLWSSYNFSPSPKLLSLYGENDCRTSIFADDKDATPAQPKFNGGKFAHFSSGNPAYGTNYIVNAPEMFLIIAEAELKSSTGTLANAQTALLTVAKRNANITSVTDLPDNKTELMAFLKDERARELFQEGMRLWDLRRWDENASVYAYSAPEIKFSFNNYKISDLVFPIPSAEVTAGFGIEQNDWSKTLPK
ncbi:RagB/SusD family nutrient uptake outer membrane protein [Phocaeicola sp.]